MRGRPAAVATGLPLRRAGGHARQGVEGIPVGPLGGRAGHGGPGARPGPHRPGGGPAEPDHQAHLPRPQAIERGDDLPAGRGDQHLDQGPRPGGSPPAGGLPRPGEGPGVPPRRHARGDADPSRPGGGGGGGPHIHHHAPAVGRHAEGGGEVPQGAVFELLRRDQPLQRPQLLLPHLRGQVHHRHDRRGHGQERSHRLRGLLPHIGGPRLHQRLHPGRPHDQPPGPGAPRMELSRGERGGEAHRPGRPGDLQPGRAPARRPLHGSRGIRHLPYRRSGPALAAGLPLLDVGEALRKPGPDGPLRQLRSEESP